VESRGFQDFFVVEYEFIVSDEAFNDMSTDLQLGYLRWWITSVELRRRVFSKRGIEGGALAHRCRVRQGVMMRVVDAACAKGLAERGASGAVKLNGVLKLHTKLRGWSDAPWPGKSEGVIAAKSVSNLREGEGEGEYPPTPHGGAGASPDKTSRREGYEALRRKVQTGAIRTASSNGILFAASVSAETKRIVLRAVGYSEADPIALGRDDPWDSYEWREAAQVKGGDAQEQR